MSRVSLSLCVLAVIPALGVPLAWGGAAEDPVHRAIRLALSEDRASHDAGVRILREAGQDGLDAILDARHARSVRAPDARWDAAIDAVAAQKDASASGLFWHTDLDAALEDARERQVPVLSLRMLGDLRDTLSCANSRFFRAILYTDPEVSDALREDFVLHWSSEREVPRITIDFGDGRVIESTITGNSAHLVLDHAGRPVDVLPGLWAPGAFLGALDEAGALHDRLAADPAHRDALLVSHHEAARDAAIARVRTVDGGDARSRVLQEATVQVRAFQDGPDGRPVPISAVDAIPLAFGKGAWEGPTVRSFTLVEAVPAFGPEDVEVGAPWPLHPATRAFLADQRAAGPDADEAALDAMIVRFRDDLARDTAWNRDVLHARVHQRFAQHGTMALEDAYVWLYDELFATPASDPWLGLWQPDVYTGLPDAGLR